MLHFHSPYNSFMETEVSEMCERVLDTQLTATAPYSPINTLYTTSFVNVTTHRTHATELFHTGGGGETISARNTHAHTYRLKRLH